MLISRRDFSLTSLALFAGLALPARSLLARPRWMRPEPEADPATYFDWKQIAPGATLASKGGGNALVLRSGDESILIDTKNCGLGDSLRREALSLAATITAVLNTHHHPDHVGGNPSFKKDIPILAHKNAAPRTADQAERVLAGLARLAKQLESGQEPAPPSVVAEVKALADHAADITPRDFVSTVPLSDMHEFRIGKLTVRMTHPGPGHTDNDMFVFLPDLNILHTGDLLFHRLHPYMDAPAGATSRGWQRSIEVMLKHCNDKTIIVPGHGDITDSSALKAQSAYFDTIRDFVSKARAQDGATRDSITQLKPPDFASLGFEQIQPTNLGVLFDELAKEAAQ